MRIAFLILAVCAGLFQLANAQQHSLHLMPMPAHVQAGTGQLMIDPAFSVAISDPSDARLQRGVGRFLNELRKQTGMLPVNMHVAAAGTTASLVVGRDRASKDVPTLDEDESYTLEITSSGAKLHAPNTRGALHGLATFLQLVEITPNGFAIPAVSIQDAPRFAWRGLLLDPGRHFLPLDVVRRNLDGMAAVKLNVLHWHLSDDQGFRVESKKFPKLHSMGSSGLYYRQEEIRDLIAYAADRGIRIMPEFDMPGHSTSWFVGYPEIASAPGPYDIERGTGVMDQVMDPTKEETYKLLSTFIAEMAKLFPDQYFHIGGDEVNGKHWDANPKIQEFMRAHAIKNNQDLQALFNTRLQKMVSNNGKTMVGWDEILRPDLPKSIVMHSWRGQESLAEAAKQGYHGLLSNGYYLDLIEPASRHYMVDPMSGAAASLSEEQKKLILGGEACMWAEFVGPETIDSRLWPRTAAIAERLWSPQSVNDVASMYQRLEQVSHKLDWLGLTHNSGYESMLARIVGSTDIAALRTLVDVLEPVKQYQRYELLGKQGIVAVPLNRLVDAARPESDTARYFSQLVDQLVAGKIKVGTEREIQRLLIRWRDQQGDLERMGQSFLLQDAAPLSHDLSALGTAGLEALDYLARGEAAPETWKTQQLALIEETKKPKAALLIMVAPAVQKLVEASAAPASTASMN